MKKTLIALLVGLLMVSVLVVPVLAKGGGGTKAKDITFEIGGNEYRAKFLKTGSGIIHQWNYYFTGGPPENWHVVFKPQDKFSRPDEEWVDWTFREIDYDSGGDDLAKVFDEDQDYWYKTEYQD